MNLLARAVVSAAAGSAASSLVAALLGRHTGAGPAAPLNAVSHMVWGPHAVHRSRPRPKYTLTGLAINYAGCLFWAGVLEDWIEARPLRSTADALGRGALVAAAAYSVDYHGIPHEYRPGYELRLRRWGMACVYAALAVALPARAWLTRSRHHRPLHPDGVSNCNSPAAGNTVLQKCRAAQSVRPLPCA